MSSEDLLVLFATIDQIYDDGITLIFDGEETASEKHYKCNSFCIFAPRQRVRIIKTQVPMSLSIRWATPTPMQFCRSAERMAGAYQGRQ